MIVAKVKFQSLQFLYMQNELSINLLDSIISPDFPTVT